MRMYMNVSFTTITERTIKTTKLIYAKWYLRKVFAKTATKSLPTKTGNDKVMKRIILRLT